LPASSTLIADQRERRGGKIHAAFAAGRGHAMVGEPAAATGWLATKAHDSSPAIGRDAARRSRTFTMLAGLRKPVAQIASRRSDA